MKGDVRIRMRDLLHFKTHDPNRTDFDSIQQMVSSILVLCFVVVNVRSVQVLRDR